MGEDEKRVGTGLEGRHEGLEARPGEANGPSGESGAKRATPFPVFPLLAEGGLAMEGCRGLDCAFADGSAAAISTSPSIRWRRRTGWRTGCARSDCAASADSTTPY